MGWVALAPDRLYMGMADSDAGVLERGTVAGDGGLDELFREQHINMVYKAACCSMGFKGGRGRNTPH